MKKISLHEAQDKILKYLVEQRKKGKIAIDSYTIWKEVYPEQKEQIVYSVLKTLLYKDIVTSDVTNDSLTNFIVFFTATDLTEMFLDQGGFSKENEEIEKVKNEKSQTDQLNKRLLVAEVAIKEFDKGLGKKLVIGGFLITLLSFVISSLNPLSFFPKDRDVHPRVDSLTLRIDSLTKSIDSINYRLRTLEESTRKDTIGKD